MMRLESGIRHKLSAVKIGQAMKQEGYESVRKNGKRGYRVIELSWEAIEQNKKSLAIFTEEPEPEDNPPETDKDLFCQDLTDKTRTNLKVRGLKLRVRGLKLRVGPLNSLAPSPPRRGSL